MKPPNWFIKEMKAFDSDLRLRWSKRLCMWQLERQVRRGLHPGTMRGDEGHDDFIRARDGFLLVLTIKPRMLCREIFESLKLSDLWSNGGWKKLADDLDAAETARENQEWKTFNDDVHAMNREAYDFIQRRNGARISSAEFPI